MGYSKNFGSPQWRSYRGFRRFNEPGPPSSWGPPSQATKNKQENNRHTAEKKTSNQSYQRQLCTSERTVSTSMTFLVCVYNLIVVLTAEMWMFQFVYFFNVVKHLNFAFLYSLLEIYGRPAITDSRIFSKNVQRPAEVYMYHSLKWTLLHCQPTVRY